MFAALAALWTSPTDDLGDGEGEGVVAVAQGGAADEVIVPLVPPAPLSKRGRPVGFQFSEASRLKMSQSALRRSASKLQDKTKVLAKALNPSTHDLAAERAFGLGERGRGAATGNIVTTTDGHGGFTRTYKDCQALNRRLWKRGVLSQVRAVRERLPDFLSQASVVIVSAVMDDANIWVKRPLRPADVKNKKKESWCANKAEMSTCQLSTSCSRWLL